MGIGDNMNQEHKKVFKKNIVCRECQGTGLYRGMAERDGSAVICLICKGTGMEKLSVGYEIFKHRKKAEDIRRVYKTAAGYGITTMQSNGIRFDLAGVSYEEWLNGAEPKPIKDLHCPYQHYGQGNDEVRVPLICDCDRHILAGRRISECPLRKSQGIEKCWAKVEEWLTSNQYKPCPYCKTLPKPYDSSKNKCKHCGEEILKGEEGLLFGCACHTGGDFCFIGIPQEWSDNVAMLQRQKEEDEK